MAGKSGPDLGINSWLEDELYQQYLHDRSAVDESWKHLFEETSGPVPARPAEAPTVNGSTAAPKAASAPAAEPGPGEQLLPLRGAAARIVQNMDASLTVPVA